MAKEVKVLVACGSGVATSTIAQEEIKDIAKEAGVKKVIVKAQNLSEKKILEKIGADKVIMPEVDSGKRLAINLITTNVIEYISFSEKFAMAEIAPLKEWIGKTLSQANIRAKYGFNVVAIKENDNVIVTPKPDDVINDISILVIIGESSQIQKFN